MGRIPLGELSALGTDTIRLADALRYSERARAVAISGAVPESLRKLRRVFRLDLGGALPPWLSKLRHLRALKLDSRKLKQLPPALFALPRLSALFLDGSGLVGLDGIERAPALRTVTFVRTPLAENTAARKALLARAGVEDLRYMTGLELAPKRTPVPRRKAALVKAIQDDLLDDNLDLRRVDLSGATFEDCYIEQDLRRANLAGTVWRRCDFTANFIGADLGGATFEDCCFDDTTHMKRVNARGVTFRRCQLDLELMGADLRDARFVDLEPDPRIDFSHARAAGMELTAQFSDESDTNISGERANLRGARIVFDLVPERRAELTKKRNPRLRWATDQFAGARRDTRTQIIYTPLPGAAGAASAVDERGPRAEEIGRIDAINASLWLLVIDAEQAAAWRGTEPSDFDRALAVEEGAIKVGAHRGLICQVGIVGWSYVWRIKDGIALVMHNANGHADKLSKPALLAALGARVAQFPVAKQQHRVGTVAVTSGCLALLLPYTDGRVTAKQLAKAKSGARALVPGRDGDRALVPLENGTYTVRSSSFAPRGYEDELGSYDECIRIVRES